MAWLAEKRLDLQKRYGMADEMTLDLDKDAKEIVNEFKSSPRGFFSQNKNNLYAVCYGMALPPEWEQNATK